MHITFQNTPSSNVDKVTTGYKTAASSPNRTEGGYALDISGTVTDNTAYGFYESRSVHGRTAEEVMQAAGNEDITLYRNYMTVMSNSMSDEDFAKLQEKGYNPMDMDIETAVTIVDTIKAELIKAGVDVVGYTDNIDMDKLAEITGSAAFAEQLAQIFSAEDVPVTQENAEQTMDAFSRGEELTELSEGTVKYMVVNDMEPVIDNLYMAEHAGAVDANRQGRGYFQEELPGYYAQKASDADLDKLKKQVEAVIEKAGYPVTEETLQDSFWLIEKGIPFTEENLKRLEELKEVKLPATKEELLTAIAGALAEGRPAGEANLSQKNSIYRRAADCLTEYENRYQENLSMEPAPETIKARRQLEEIRLHMTLEANIKLLKSGFSIDTAPMEEMIDALKALEEKQAGTDFSTGTPADICKETMARTGEIPYLPAAALGRILSQGESLTVTSVYETGKSLQEAFRQAGEAYETMMTPPRADMGDSIKAAFRNVDALLANMGQELTDENRKAVRSLSYSRMELTEENLLAIKGADKVVQRVVEKMTPSAVLSMIREGINPLKTAMEELDSYLSERDTYTEESTEYSRFLYNMEQNKEITSAEKESYIGIYRLLRQIEKSDGAAVGRLVSSQAELSFENLLSAIRTGRIRGVDVSVDESFGSLKEAAEKGVSIDTQIETAYQETLLSGVRDINKVGDDAVNILTKLQEPVTIDNLLAADAVLKDGARPFKKLAENKTAGTKQQKGKEEAVQFHTEASVFENVEDIFSDRNHVQQAYEELMTEQEKLAREMTFAEGMGSLDVRAMQLVCKQLHIQGLRGLQEEEYDLPQVIDGELTAVHLKVVHDSKESGKLSVKVDTIGYGYLSGEFSVSSGSVSGYFAGTGKESEAVLEKTAEVFTSRLQGAGMKVLGIRVIKANAGSALVENGGGKEETQELYRVAGMAIGALKEAIERSYQYEN